MTMAEALEKISIEEITDFQILVLDWAKYNGRIFLWRRANESKYRLVVTELLLQRTKAETVRSYYESFFFHFPNWKSLSIALETKIREILKPLGFWRRRGTVLKRLACVMVDHNGRFPIQREEIDLLPGVGQYIGNAIELLCLNRTRPLLDAGMARVLGCYFGNRKLTDIRYDPYLQELSHRVVNHERPKDINWAILDLEALLYRTHVSLCKECNLSSKCRAGRNFGGRLGNGVLNKKINVYLKCMNFQFRGITNFFSPLYTP